MHLQAAIKGYLAAHRCVRGPCERVSLIAEYDAELFGVTTYDAVGGGGVDVTCQYIPCARTHQLKLLGCLDLLANTDILYIL